LVDAANDAGGKDNITVLFVAGPDFIGRAAAARERHSITRQRKPSPTRIDGRQSGTRRGWIFVLGLLAGLLLGVLVGRLFRW
jgi:hypothetical protein